MDEPIKKPTQFTLVIIDESKNKIDSLLINRKFVMQSKKRDNYQELLIDYDWMEKNSFIKILLDGKHYIINLNHDWRNWYDNKETIFIYENGYSLNSKQKRAKDLLEQ